MKARQTTTTVAAIRRAQIGLLAAELDVDASPVDPYLDALDGRLRQEIRLTLMAGRPAFHAAWHLQPDDTENALQTMVERRGISTEQGRAALAASEHAPDALATVGQWLSPRGPLLTLRLEGGWTWEATVRALEALGVDEELATDVKARLEALGGGAVNAIGIDWPASDVPPLVHVEADRWLPEKGLGVLGELVDGFRASEVGERELRWVRGMVSALAVLPENPAPVTVAVGPDRRVRGARIALPRVPLETCLAVAQHAVAPKALARALGAQLAATGHDQDWMHWTTLAVRDEGPPVVLFESRGSGLPTA